MPSPLERHLGCVPTGKRPSLANTSCEGGYGGLTPPRKLEYLLQERRSIDTTNASATCRASPIAFVGIGKTGSLFVQAALELFAHDQLLPTVNQTPASRPCAVGARMGWHHASAQLWRRAFDTAWLDAYTFAVVRDPWARLVSHWTFHLVDGSARRNPLDGGYLTDAQRQAARANENVSIAHFRSWVHHTRRVIPPDAADAWRFTTCNPHGNEQSRGFNASQLSWLVDEAGLLLVDDVFRLEDLERRWPELQRRVCGLKTYRDTISNPILRALDHSSGHAPYEAYFDAETSAIVAEYMEPDIRTFGYEPPVLS